jgi:hypothetical protein
MNPLEQTQLLIDDVQAQLERLGFQAAGPKIQLAVEPLVDDGIVRDDGIIDEEDEQLLSRVIATRGVLENVGLGPAALSQRIGSDDVQTTIVKGSKVLAQWLDADGSNVVTMDGNAGCIRVKAVPDVEADGSDGGLRKDDLIIEVSDGDGTVHGTPYDSFFSAEAMAMEQYTVTYIRNIRTHTTDEEHEQLQVDVAAVANKLGELNVDAGIVGKFDDTDTPLDDTDSYEPISDGNWPPLGWPEMVQRGPLAKTRIHPQGEYTSGELFNDYKIKTTVVKKKFPDWDIVYSRCMLCKGPACGTKYGPGVWTDPYVASESLDVTAHKEAVKCLWTTRGGTTGSSSDMEGVWDTGSRPGQSATTYVRIRCSDLPSGAGLCKRCCDPFDNRWRAGDMFKRVWGAPPYEQSKKSRMKGKANTAMFYSKNWGDALFKVAGKKGKRGTADGSERE